ncbi:MAG: DUF6442 family protein [Clostridia bacterium]|nr:DUF6442 family protein [Clostridia bacterium]
MNKEEILEESRKENKKKDVYEIEIENRGSKYAALAMLILITVYYVFEIFTGKGSNPALYSVIAIFSAVLYGYKAIKTEKRRGLHIFTSILWVAVTVILVLEYFKVV